MLIFYGIIQLFQKRKRTVEYKPDINPEPEPVPKPKPKQFDPLKDDPDDFVGRRPNTRLEQKKIDKQMKEFLERHPNHSFWKDHPEYMEKYLGDIDLSELNLDK